MTTNKLTQSFVPRNNPSYGVLWRVASHQLEEPGRYYHNTNHTTQVLLACKEILQTHVLPTSLWMAAAWHDVIYVPGSKTNEEASAQHLAWTLKIWGHEIFETAFHESLEYAQSLIRETVVDNHMSPTYVPTLGLADVLLDADLWSLSTDYLDFEATQFNIIKELGLSDTAESRSGSAKFLQKFLDKPNIYHTEYAQGNWETRARSNILTYHRAHASKDL